VLEQGNDMMWSFQNHHLSKKKSSCENPNLLNQARRCWFLRLSEITRSQQVTNFGPKACPEVSEFQWSAWPDCFELVLARVVLPLFGLILFSETKGSVWFQYGRDNGSNRPPCWVFTYESYEAIESVCTFIGE
jgi:hypothetical protein